jgi:acetylornithine deacetylase/succinyl-diaminopimelate desuccinylase-like protein
VDATVVAARVEQVWDADVLPAVEEYIRIPNLSPMFDSQWAEHGHMAAAVELVERWCATRPIAGLSVSVRELDGRTPVIVMEVPAFGSGSDARGDDTVLLYGHLDKQPEMVGWREGLGPWTPVRDGDRLYGRGGADDGYSAFAALTAIEAVQAGGGAHARCVVLIEASEESGSRDLPAHVDALAAELGSPSLVVCLDSGCADYDELWLTTSLRGLVGLNVTVRILDEGVHSGSAGGVVPSSFRVLRALLSRIEDEATGEILVPELHVPLPIDRANQIAEAATVLGDAAGGVFPVVAGAAKIDAGDAAAQLRHRTWEPAMEVVGMDGVPPTAKAGNVLRPVTTAKLSFRLPPTCDAKRARDALVAALTSDPPYGAAVTVTCDDLASGWNAPAMAPWLVAAVDDAGQAAFGQDGRAMGEGGTIPFMAMLGEQFPDAQFVITGVLGPGSNAHGPNEFLHIPTAIGVTKAVAHLLHAHATR